MLYSLYTNNSKVSNKINQSSLHYDLTADFQIDSRYGIRSVFGYYSKRNTSCNDEGTVYVQVD